MIRVGKASTSRAKTTSGCLVDVDDAQVVAAGSLPVAQIAQPPDSPDGPGEAAADEQPQLQPFLQTRAQAWPRRECSRLVLRWPGGARRRLPRSNGEADAGDPGPLGELAAPAMHKNPQPFIVPDLAGPAGSGLWRCWSTTTSPCQRCASRRPGAGVRAAKKPIRSAGRAPGEQVPPLREVLPQAPSRALPMTCAVVHEVGFRLGGQGRPLPRLRLGIRGLTRALTHDPYGSVPRGGEPAKAVA